MMLRRAALLLLACAALTAGAADPKKPADPPPLDLAPEAPQGQGRCVLSRASCIDFEGTFAGGAAEAACARAKGAFAAGTCPVEGRVGTCFQRAPGSPDRTLTRAYAPARAKDVKAACKKLPNGVFMVR